MLQQFILVRVDDFFRGYPAAAEYDDLGALFSILQLPFMCLCIAIIIPEKGMLPLFHQ